MEKKTRAKTVKRAAKPKAPSTGREIAKPVGPEHYFFLRDGRPLKSLLELADALEEMNDDVFNHHVTDDKNDFATWVHDVFHDEALAIRLGQAKSKQAQQLIILKHLVRRLSK